MFGDLAEQEHVFSLLDDWAHSHEDVDLTYDTGSKSNFNKEITELIKAVQSKELETIKKNPKLKLGFSFQSELLGDLWGLLTYANSPSKLLSKLSEIKIALLQAMIISYDIKNDRLKLLAKVGNAVIAGGKKGNLKTYGNEKEKTEKRDQWQKWVNETIEKHPKHSFEAIKKIVVKDHPEVSIYQLKRYTKDSGKINLEQ